MRPVYSAVAMVAFALVALVIVSFSHRVELTCERVMVTHGSCESRDRGLFGTGRTRSISVERIGGALVVDKGGPSAVSLVVDGYSDTPLSDVSESWLTEDKARMVADIARFVNDPSQTQLATAYGSRWSNGAPALVLDALLAALVLWGGRWRVRMTVDRVTREVILEQARPFFAPRVRSLPLASVEGVAIDVRPGPRRSSTRHLVLVRDDGQREPLPSGFYPFGNDLERASAAMDAAIRDARRLSGALPRDL